MFRSIDLIIMRNLKEFTVCTKLKCYLTCLFQSKKFQKFMNSSTNKLIYIPLITICREVDDKEKCIKEVYLSVAAVYGAIVCFGIRLEIE